MIRRSLFSLALCFFSTLVAAEPVVTIELPGLLGNRLFGFTMAKILAEEMGYKVHCGQIWGFPSTYDCHQNVPCRGMRRQVVKDGPNFNFDINAVIGNRQPRIIMLDGYFQGYQTLKPYKDKIRNEWLKLSPELSLPKNHDSIVVHVRARYPDVYYIPFEYYKTALDRATYDKVYICTDDPNHPFLRNFAPYNPVIVSTRDLIATMDRRTSWDEISKVNMDDFIFMMSFDKIIISFSTYSWWAAFLSDAKEIYAPYPTNPNFQYLSVDDETRYINIPTSIGK